MKKLTNVTRKEFEKFLAAKGYTLERTTGGHAIWTCPDSRSVVLQTHVNPIPVIVIKSNLLSMGVTSKDLLDFLEQYT